MTLLRSLLVAVLVLGSASSRPALAQKSLGVSGVPVTSGLEAPIQVESGSGALLQGGATAGSASHNLRSRSPGFKSRSKRPSVLPPPIYGRRGGEESRSGEKRSVSAQLSEMGHEVDKAVSTLSRTDATPQDLSAAGRNSIKALTRERWHAGTGVGNGVAPESRSKAGRAAQADVPAPAAFELRHSLDLADFRGQTFLQSMTAKKGIKAALDHDLNDDYKIAGWAAVESALKHFDRKVAWKILKAFPDKERGLRRLVESLEGKPFKPASIVGLVGRQVKGREVFDVAQFLALASGAGTLVRVDKDNYYYNYGYRPGTSPDDVKSGRSFGASPKHRANDASDTFFLTELGDYLDSTPDARPYYRALMQVLTRSDPSGISGLTPAGQAVATDFTAIYTAELDRHIMVKLNPWRHPWENDLAEVTFLSAYGTASGKILVDGLFQDGSPKQYWAMSKLSNRSGIGQTRKDRRKLQRMLSAYMRRTHPEVTEAIEQVIGGRGPRGDLFQGVMEFLNNYKNQARVRANAAELTEAFVEFLDRIRQDADQVTTQADQLQQSVSRLPPVGLLSIPAWDQRPNRWAPPSPILSA